MGSPQILIVEDEAVTARLLQHTLEKLGYAVCHMASSGEAALAYIQAEPPDLVLMDIVLEGPIDGIETASQINSRFRLPVVFLTGQTDTAMIERAKHTEPLGYLHKPFTETDLRSTIEIALHNHAYKKKLQTELFYQKLVIDQERVFVIVDSQGALRYASQRFYQLSGLRPEEWQGSSLYEYFRLHSSTLPEQIFKTLAAGKVWQGQLPYRREQSPLKWAVATVILESETMLDHLSEPADLPTEWQHRFHQLPPLQQEQEFRKILVEMMQLAVAYWEQTTLQSKAELAEASQIWRVSLNKGCFETRTLNKYLSLQRLPQKPRYRDALKTAYYVLNTCQLDSPNRHKLQDELAKLQYLLRFFAETPS